MIIQNFTSEYESTFTRLFVDYFTELDSTISEEALRSKLIPHILKLAHGGQIRICLAYWGEKAIGFSLYQIDTPESDWCKRPGWGIIREFYIAPDYRRQGFGTALAEYSYQALLTLGAKSLYLTADDAMEFWQHCGWKLTDEACSNGLLILEKRR